jgi:hypothetical protein
MRVPLPTYPLDRQRYWVDLDLRTNANQLGPRSKPYNKRLEMENWFRAGVEGNAVFAVNSHLQQAIQSVWDKLTKT